MINFADKFKQLEEIVNSQKRLSINSCLKVYYGISHEKKLRISFVTSVIPYELTSTKEIKVTQGKESENIYWTCFDLIKDEAKEIFFIFCDSLIKSIENVDDENEALGLLRERYYAWRSLFKNKRSMSYEQYQGLYGELFYIVKILSNQLCMDDAVNAWVGPEGYSKDFSENNTWYEIKTIGTSSNTIKINSLAQLDSELDGHLIVIIVEKMSEQFDGDFSNVLKLYRYILNNIISRNNKEIFINKVLKYGFIDEDETINNYNYEVKTINSYLVNEKFPKLTRSDIKEHAILNVTYEVSINALEKFKEE